MVKVMGVIGIFVIMLIAFIFSENKKAISISQILWAFGLQLLLAVFILRDGFLSKAVMMFFLLLVFYFNIHKVAEEKIKNTIVRHLIVVSTFAILTTIFVLLPKVITVYLLYAFLIVVVLYLMSKLFMIPKVKELKIGYIFGAIFCVLAASYSIQANFTGSHTIELFSAGVTKFLSFNREGALFVFGPLLDRTKMGFIFALSILGSSIYFGAMIALFDYLGVTYSVVMALSRFMTWHMGLFKIKPLSGVEMLISTANIVLSMNASPLLVKSYLPKLTMSEIATIMTVGLATIAGGTMAIFINMGIPASYLIAASVMSTPAAILLAKMVLPETDKPETLGVSDLKSEKTAERVKGGAVGAISNGIAIGTRTGISISASVLAFLGIIALINWLIGSLDAFIDGKLLASVFGNVQGVPPYKGIIPSSLTDLFRYIGKPFAILLGVENADAGYVGELLSLKITANEAVAYAKLLEFKEFISERSLMISSYALCGFANFGSLGILLGAMNGVCPERSGDFAKFGVKAVFFGALASWMTAAFAGIIS